MASTDTAVPQAELDALITTIGQAAAQNDDLDALRAQLSPAQQREMDAAFERHAGRMRASGNRGW